MGHQEGGLTCLQGLAAGTPEEDEEHATVGAPQEGVRFCEAWRQKVLELGDAETGQDSAVE